MAFLLHAFGLAPFADTWCTSYIFAYMYMCTWVYNNTASDCYYTWLSLYCSGSRVGTGGGRKLHNDGASKPAHVGGPPVEGLYDHPKSPARTSTPLYISMTATLLVPCTCIYTCVHHRSTVWAFMYTRLALCILVVNCIHAQVHVHVNVYACTYMHVIIGSPERRQLNFSLMQTATHSNHGTPATTVTHTPGKTSHTHLKLNGDNCTLQCYHSTGIATCTCTCITYMYMFVYICTLYMYLPTCTLIHVHLIYWNSDVLYMCVYMYMYVYTCTCTCTWE